MRTEHQTERFPQSALLFKFCFSVLQRHAGGQKAHDQDIGNILNYNASDTSHWKRGKKSIKSVYALELLARKLDVDFEILHDLSDGALDFEEAWFEFGEAENLRELASKLSPEMQRLRALRVPILEDLAARILAKADVGTIPVFVPEVVAALPFIEIVARDVGDKLARATRVKQGFYSIRYRKGDMRAHTRVAIAREIARIVLHSERQQFDLPVRVDELLPFEVEQLSSALLVPLTLFKAEFQKISARLDVSAALADTFWVPKTVIRARLSQAITERLSFDVVASGQFVVNARAEEKVFQAEDLVEDDTDERVFSPSVGPQLATLN
jgi:hypothetical protein